MWYWKIWCNISSNFPEEADSGIQFHSTVICQSAKFEYKFCNIPENSWNMVPLPYVKDISNISHTLRLTSI
jgi:hypothetical protein